MFAPGVNDPFRQSVYPRTTVSIEQLRDDDYFTHHLSFKKTKVTSFFKIATHTRAVKYTGPHNETV